MQSQQENRTVVPHAIAPDAFSSMFQSIAGLRNLRAAAAMAICFVAAILLAGLMAAIFRSSMTMLALGGLAAMVLFFAGVHAAGVLLMDQATNVPMRSVSDAVVYGILCVPKTIGLVIALVLGVIGVYIAMAVVLYVCKMPGLGPVLFTIAFPAVVVVAGLTFTGMFIAFQMALAAFWAGAGVVSAIAQSIAILRRRLVETVMLLVVVSAIAGVVFGIVAVVLLFGFWPAVGLSASIIGVSGIGDVSSTFSNMMYGGMGGGGHLMAGAIGGGVLWALALTLVFQVGLMGVNLVYLRVSEGLDASATEQAMRARFDDAKRKAAEMGQQAKEAAERARAQAERVRAQAAQAAQERRADQAPSSAADPIAPTGQVCPHCTGAVTRDDVFCGHCGHRLG